MPYVYAIKQKDKTPRRHQPKAIVDAMSSDRGGSVVSWCRCPMAPGSFGGPDASAANRRLIENSPAQHLTFDDFQPDIVECRLDRVV